MALEQLDSTLMTEEKIECGSGGGGFAMLTMVPTAADHGVCVFRVRSPHQKSATPVPKMRKRAYENVVFFSSKANKGCVIDKYKFVDGSGERIRRATDATVQAFVKDGVHNAPRRVAHISGTRSREDSVPVPEDSDGSETTFEPLSTEHSSDIRVIASTMPKQLVQTSTLVVPLVLSHTPAAGSRTTPMFSFSTPDGALAFFEHSYGDALKVFPRMHVLVNDEFLAHLGQAVGDFPMVGIAHLHNYASASCCVFDYVFGKYISKMTGKRYSKEMHQLQKIRHNAKDQRTRDVANGYAVMIMAFVVRNAGHEDACELFRVRSKHEATSILEMYAGPIDYCQSGRVAPVNTSAIIQVSAPAKFIGTPLIMNEHGKPVECIQKVRTSSDQTQIIVNLPQGADVLVASAVQNVHCEGKSVGFTTKTSWGMDYTTVNVGAHDTAKDPTLHDNDNDGWEWVEEWMLRGAPITKQSGVGTYYESSWSFDMLQQRSFGWDDAFKKVAIAGLMEHVAASMPSPAASIAYLRDLDTPVSTPVDGDQSVWAARSTGRYGLKSIVGRVPLDAIDDAYTAIMLRKPHVGPDDAVLHPYRLFSTIVRNVAVQAARITVPTRRSNKRKAEVMPHGPVKLRHSKTVRG